MRLGGNRGGSSTPSTCVRASRCIGVSVVVGGISAVGVGVSFVLKLRCSDATGQQ
jgi:hypothetical protein